MGLMSTIFASLAFIGGYVGQNVLVVYWTKSSLSPYGVLLVNCLFFPFIFGLMLVGYALLRRERRVFLTSDHEEQRSLLKFGSESQTLLWIGFFNALNGLGIVYASPPTRTPPLIQAVLQNSGVLFSVPFSLWWLGDKKKYFSFWPIVAALLVASSVVISILPTILDGNAGSGVDGAKSVAWCIVYLAGLIPGAAYNVLQQRYLIQSGALRQGASVRRLVTSSLRMLFYGCFWMLVFMVALFWTDLLPWFGNSSVEGRSAYNDLVAFGELTGFSLACSFGGPAAVGDVATSFPALNATTTQCDGPVPAYAYGFVGSYTVAYLGGAVLNRESSTYTMLCFVLITLFTSAVWYIPGVNPNSEHTPVWSVATSIVLSLLGVFIWKRWEMQSESHDQFHLEPSSLVDAEEVGTDASAFILAGRKGGYVALMQTTGVLGAGSDSDTEAAGGSGSGTGRFGYLASHGDALQRGGGYAPSGKGDKHSRGDTGNSSLNGGWWGSSSGGGGSADGKLGGGYR